MFFNHDFEYLKMFHVQSKFPGVGLYKHVAEDAGIGSVLWFMFVQITLGIF